MAAPRETTVRVKDFQLFMTALAAADKKMQKAVRDEIRTAGEHVRLGAGARFAGYDARSAAGYRTVVRRRGVAVEQRLRRTTGKRPDFGRLQMRRALIPALDANEQNTIRAIDQALDRIAARFNQGNKVV